MAIKFILEEPVLLHTDIKGIAHQNKVFKLTPEGEMIIYMGFKWDGCTPKFNFLDITWGTPDGRLNRRTNRPMTYYASLVHDVLYQSSIPITRKQADDEWLREAKKAGFKLAGLYNIFNRLFGRFFRRWKTP